MFPFERILHSNFVYVAFVFLRVLMGNQNMKLKANSFVWLYFFGGFFFVLLAVGCLFLYVHVCCLFIYVFVRCAVLME